MVSIVDVARHADVSAKTVSRVINNDASVRPRTRRLVEQAIAELGYIPNAAARSLRNSRTNTIGFVVPDLGNPAYDDFVTGIERVVREHNYSLLLCDSQGRAEIQAANLRRLFERRVEGLLFHPIAESCPELEVFVRAQVPVVVMTSVPFLSGVPQLYINQQAGLHEAVEYLRDLGHTRIAFIGSRFPPASFRTEGFRKSLLALGLPHDPSLVALVASRDELSRTVTNMLTRSDRPTAVIAGIHTLAPYLLGTIYAAGMEIPRDISFITMGDSPWARFYRPPLTVTSTDRTERGRMAAEYLFLRLAGVIDEGLLREMKSKLVIRESCAAIR